MHARFVVQEHHARTHHYDFRLERDGVYKSWAVPKGIPEDAGLRRLAVQVPDHPLDWGSFEGTIPEGRYGAGSVAIWDEGTYDLLEWTDEAIAFILHGRRLRGAYALVRFHRKGPRDWLLFRRSEPAGPAPDPERYPAPSDDPDRPRPRSGRGWQRMAGFRGLLATALRIIVIASPGESIANPFKYWCTLFAELPKNLDSRIGHSVLCCGYGENQVAFGIILQL